MSFAPGAVRAAVLGACALVVVPAFAAPLTVKFSQCSEFVGLVPIPADKAQALLPARYALVAMVVDTGP